MNKQQLAATLWASANDLRGKMDASEYKNYILGFLFYKFLSEHLENYLIKNEVTFADLDDDSIETIKEDLGYFIAESDLYRTWIANIAERKWKLSHVTDAINHFNENLYETQREDFEGVFADVILTSEKLGKDLSDKEIAIRKLIELLNKINITGNREYDVFGYIYEYLIAQFAMASGKKAGEFYTPHQVSRIMAAIVADELRPKEQSAVYDPTCGSGSLLLTVSDAVNHYEHKDNIQFFGQENNSTTYNIARMNLLMRGVKPANMILRNADTLKTDWPYGEVNGEDNPLFVDCVVANPPYSAKWNSERADKDTRFKELKISYLEKMFPKGNERYPELRFPNFTDAWEQRKLGDICNITTGKLDANAMVENGKYDFFTSGIKKYKIDHYAFLGPALTIAGNGATVGYMHYADGFFNAYQRTYVLTELLGDRTFLFSTINRTLQKKIQQEARAGNIPYIVLDMLTELDIYLPSLEEQTQIGNFFKQLDDTIALHQREVEKYKKIKQSYLEKMFI